MFLQVGETDRPRFPPVYSAILGAGYSRLHFGAPPTPSFTLSDFTALSPSLKTLR